MCYSVCSQNELALMHMQDNDTGSVSQGHLEMPVLGLLVLGAFSIRMVTNWDKKTKKVRHTYWDRDDEGDIIFVDTDSKAVNEWLLTRSLAYLDVQCNPQLDEHNTA